MKKQYLLKNNAIKNKMSDRFEFSIQLVLSKNTKEKNGVTIFWEWCSM